MIDSGTLRRIAEAADADKKPWEWQGGYPQRVVRAGDVVVVADCFEDPDSPARFAEFIATFDPPTVLTLVADLERERARADRLAEQRREDEDLILSQGRRMEAAVERANQAEAALKQIHELRWSGKERTAPAIARAALEAGNWKATPSAAAPGGAAATMCGKSNERA